MPRSITRPQVGSIVWYFSAATGVPPQAAIVAQVVDKTHFNLAVISPAGAVSAQANVEFVDPSLRATAAWCTWPRIEMFLAGDYPEIPPRPLAAALPSTRMAPLAAAAGGEKEEKEEKEDKDEEDEDEQEEKPAERAPAAPPVQRRPPPRPSPPPHERRR